MQRWTVLKAPKLSPRYTREGLLRYLQAPQDRWNGQGSMFALTAAQLKMVQGFLDKNSREAPPDRRLVDVGQKLFLDLGCEKSHQGQGPGPLLQLGYPFLSQNYFNPSVRHGKDRMPAFPQLKPALIQALYAYISLTSLLRLREPQCWAYRRLQVKSCIDG